jgi:hypothetical protein
VLGDVRDGTYHVRARMIGYSPLDTTITLGHERAPLVLRIAPAAIRLATVPVTATRNRGCVATSGPRAASDPQLAAIFDQLETNIERYHILLDQYPFHYRRLETEVIQINGRVDSLVSVDTVTYDSRDRRPYHVGSIVYDEVTIKGRKAKKMYLPTFADLGDSAFDAAHCFTYRGTTKDREIQIDFRPADRIAVPDVDGSVYLDADRYIVRRATFHLTKPHRVGANIAGLTVTTTFEEVLPLVPILATTVTEQPLLPILNHGVEATSAGRVTTWYDLHPLLKAIAIENDVVLDHTFIADDIANAKVAAEQPAPAFEPTRIAIGCTMPPSFETTDVPIYGTVGGASPGNPNNDRLTLGIRRQFRLPDNLALTVYGFEFDSKVAPTLTGQVAFTLSRGRVQTLALTATSLNPAVDSALVTAVRRADSLKAFVGVPAGRYTMSLSSATPDARALAIDIAHVAVPVVPLAHKAKIDFDATPPPLPTGSGTFQFVVDERGRAIPSTLVTVASSSMDFAVAVGKGLDKLRFDPAVAGNCPIKQVIQQPFQAQYRVQEQ